MLTLIETDETDNSLHVVGIRIAGGCLKDESRLFNTRLRGDRKHYGCDLIDRRDVEDQSIVRRNLRLTFANQEDDRRGSREALVPTGERIRHCRFDNAG